MTCGRAGFRALAGALGAALVFSGCAWVTRASVGTGGVEGTAPAFGTPALSSDGRWVAFTSDAANIVTGINLPPNIDVVYERDQLTGTTIAVSVASNGTPPDDNSANPAISADGRFVAFESDATTLVPNDLNANRDIFVHDRVLNTTTRVSVDSHGGEGDGDSTNASISADGSKIVFTSWSDTFDPLDGNGFDDVFLHNMKTGTTTRVGVGAANAEAMDGTRDGVISADGTRVAFDTDEPFSASDTNDVDDVYVRDLGTLVTSLVSKTATGGIGTNMSDMPSINSDGSKISFLSLATNLDAKTDTNNTWDVFVRNGTTSTTVRADVGPGGVVAGAGVPFAPAPISGDGRYVTFESTSTNLVSSDGNGATSDVFVRDVQNGTTNVVSTAQLLGQMSGASTGAAISTDGRYVAFLSRSALDGSDLNGVADIYERSIPVPTVTSVSPTTAVHGTTVTLTINGASFVNGAGVTIANGFTIGTVTRLSDSQLTAVVTIPPSAIGSYNVGVTNPGTGPGPLTGSLGACPGCLKVT